MRGVEEEAEPPIFLYSVYIKQKKVLNMKRKGSIIADEIIRDSYREKKLKQIYESNKRLKDKKKEPVSSTKPYETRKLTTGLDELMK